MPRGHARFTFMIIVVAFVFTVGQGFAQTLTPEEEAAKAKYLEEQKPKLRSRIAIYGWVESSVTGNPAGPSDHQNFGRLFDDRSNEAVMNQAVVTAERTLEGKENLDWGFKVQLLFGTDARYIHSLGMRYPDAGEGLYQGDVPEVYLSLHLPALSEGGIDVKLGKFVSIEGAETIDPRPNPFYSHTYIFNFGIPATNTGVLFTFHSTDSVDLYAGVTRGVNTSYEDNNDSLAFDGGIGLNAYDGKLTLLASTHIGPETSRDNGDLRYLNDAAITVKMNDKYTFIADLNYTIDSAAGAGAYGAALYLIYAVDSKLNVGMRGELWRDDRGYYIAQYADPGDPIRGLGGDPTIDPRTVGADRTTYGAFTVGVDIKLPAPKPLAGFRLRPELRVDHAFNDSHPFNDSTDNTMFTAALDVIVTF